MSSYPAIRAFVDPQLRCGLFRTPIEIRRAIYNDLIPNKVHAFLQQDKIHISACIEPSPTDDGTGFELQTSGDRSSDDTTWARRLRSSWGPHWKCEEVALRIDDNHEAVRNAHATFLLVCKRMYIDVVDHMVDTAVFNITNLDTLKYLLQTAGASSSGDSYTSDFLSPVFPYIKKLDITLKLPLSDCKALDDQGAASSCGSPPTDSSTAGSASQLTAWLQLCPAITQLKQLRSLNIWLDHDQRPSWSVVNERAILSALEPLLGIPKLNISVNLPKLHPRWETPDRHFTEGSPTPPFRIHRRVRQRYFCVENSIGQLRVGHRADFPLLYGEFSSEEFPLAEIEQWERDLWKRGINPRAELEDMFMETFPPENIEI